MKRKIWRRMAISGCLWAMLALAVGVAQGGPLCGWGDGSSGSAYGNREAATARPVGMAGDPLAAVIGAYGDPLLEWGDALPDPELEFVLFTGEGRTRVERGLRRDTKMWPLLGKRLGQIDLQYRGPMATAGLPMAGS